jgi:hypothetical protein
MNILDLNKRPGKVVEAEIRRRFSSIVNFDPSLSPHDIYLVLSFGH